MSDGLAETRLAGLRAHLEAYRPAPGWRAWLYEFILFGIKQGWACLFGGLMLGLLLGTHLFYPADAAISRYDVLTLSAVVIQLGMLATGLETRDEAVVILAFHAVGTVMEVFKTAVGSWHYPEAALLRIGGVPLFSGFMYAAVGSYIARIWRIMDFRFVAFPPIWAARLVAVAIYLNFFAHHWLPDLRIVLFVAIGGLFWGTRIVFRVWQQDRWMPLLVGWLLVALFIWFAENIGTFSNAWLYPDQRAGWQPVSPAKLGAWYLLMYISFMLVAARHGVRAGIKHPCS